MLSVVTLVLSLILFFSVIWIIVPAPSYYVWLFSVGVSEWSLWFGAAATVTLLASLTFVLTTSGGSGGGKLWIVSLVISLVVLGISFYPFFSVRPLADEHHVALSFSEYFTGSFTNRFAAADFTTYEFGGDGGHELKLDFLPPQIENKNNGAAIIVVHGGGWNARERNDFPQWNRWLAAHGFAVFDIDYRLAPQPNYLTATGDVKCAVRWIKWHAAKFNITPDRIALFGRSAGAHLALVAAYSSGDERLPPSCRPNDRNESARAVVSFYAPVELLWAYDHPANQSVLDGPQTLADFIGGSPHSSAALRERFELAAPTTHISAGTPPTLVVHGGRDQLVRKENLSFLAEKLKQNRVPHETLLIPYAQHGFDYNLHGWGSQITKSVMLDFLSAHTAAN